MRVGVFLSVYYCLQLICAPPLLVSGGDPLSLVALFLYVSLSRHLMRFQVPTSCRRTAGSRQQVYATSTPAFACVGYAYIATVWSCLHLLVFAIIDIVLCDLQNQTIYFYY